MMTSLQAKKPFHKKTFYLDLKGYRHETELIKDLKRLGGKQESFLSKEVSFVITSRIPVKNDFPMCLTPKSYSSVPSPLPFNGSVFEGFESPPYTSSPVPDENCAFLSRGLSLVQKARQKKQGTTDVLEVCKQWKIKVIPLQKILLWLSKNKTFNNKKDELKKAKHIEDVQKLQTPFLKVEDVKREYKTRHKVFNNWTESIDQEFQGTIRRLCNRVRESQTLDFDNLLSRPVLKERNFQSIRQSPTPPLFLPSVNKSASVSIATVSGQFNINPYASNSIQFSTDKKKEPKASVKENMKRPGNDCHKKHKRRYCEVCSNYFMHLDEHLETEPHQKFFKNASNFNVLQDIVLELPTLDQFLNSTKAPFQNQNEDKGEKDVITPCDKNSMPPLIPVDMVMDPLHASVEMPRLDSFKENVDSYTEMYSVLDEYISGSCSTPEHSSTFPFLEDTVDGLEMNSKNPTLQNDSLIVIDSVHYSSEGSTILLEREIEGNCEKSQTGVFIEECGVIDDPKGCVTSEAKEISKTHDVSNVPMASNDDAKHFASGESTVKDNASRNVDELKPEDSVTIGNNSCSVTQEINIQNLANTCASNDCMEPVYGDVSYENDNGAIENNEPVDFSLNSNYLQKLESLKTCFDNNEGKSNTDTTHKFIITNITGCYSKDANDGLESKLENDKNYIFSDAVSLVKDMYFSSGLNQYQTALSVKNDVACQSNGQDVISSCGDDGEWVVLCSEVDSLCKSLDEDENVLDLCINKENISAV